MTAECDIEGSIARITMDKGKVNALDFPMIEEIDAALDLAETEHAAVVLTGRPGMFSAGFELDVINGPEGPDLLKAGFRLSHRLLSLPLPVVVACSGHALAMGVFLLLSGDYRLGAADSPHKIRANEVAIGMTMPRSALVVSRQRLTPQSINRVILCAETFAPDSAVGVGLLDEVVPSSQLLEHATNKAQELLALNRRAFASTKRRYRNDALMALEEAIEADYATFTKTGAES